ncbi:hypothetical protein ACFV9G_23205 [Nocardioides sp. NPDC059952]|uniref:hypothetical protein n=1 Tax=Nocardioides sp. NPDC059952 TaxID=3347014 RepID=UPI0036593B99
MLHSHRTQLVAAILGVLSAATLTAIPLFKAAGVRSLRNDIPWWIYAVLLSILIASQLVQLISALMSARATKAELGVVASESIRILVGDVCGRDRMLTDLSISPDLAVRVSSVDGQRLIEADWGKGGLMKIPSLGSPLRRVQALPTPASISDFVADRKIFGAVDVQDSTGLRFEVFYLLPAGISELEGTPLGDSLVKKLIKDDRLAFIIARIPAS